MGMMLTRHYQEAAERAKRDGLLSHEATVARQEQIERENAEKNAARLTAQPNELLAQSPQRDADGNVIPSTANTNPHALLSDDPVPGVIAPELDPKVDAQGDTIPAVDALPTPGEGAGKTTPEEHKNDDPKSPQRDEEGRVIPSPATPDPDAKLSDDPKPSTPPPSVSKPQQQPQKSGKNR